MPVNVSWDDDAKKTIRLNYVGKWAWEEVYKAMDEGNTLIRSVTYPVCIIHDLTASAGLPSGALTHAYRFTVGLPTNWDMSVVVGSGAFTESLLNVFSKVYKKLGEHYKTARTLDEARTMIAQRQSKAT